MNIRGEKMVKINYQLTDEEKFEIYKSVKRNLQKHYYENRTEEQIEKRLARASWEMEQSAKYDHVVVNHVVEDCAAEILKIIANVAD